MKVPLLTAYFPPDTDSAAHLFYDLGTALSTRGHEVTVLTGMPGYPAQGSLERYKGKKWMGEKVNGVDVVRVATPQLPRRLMVGRALWQFGRSDWLSPPVDILTLRERWGRRPREIRFTKTNRAPSKSNGRRFRVVATKTVRGTCSVRP